MPKAPKQLINARLSLSELEALDELESQWGCNRTDAVARAIVESRDRLKSFDESWGLTKSASVPIVLDEAVPVDSVVGIDTLAVKRKSEPWRRGPRPKGSKL